MKTIEDISKKSIFEVPDGYFDQLPLQIMAKVEKKPSLFELPLWRFSVRYAVPIIVLSLGLAYFFAPKSVKETEELLSSISNEHLISYLHETDINLSDLIDAANLNDADADSLSLKVNSHYLLEEKDVMELKREMENEL